MTELIADGRGVRCTIAVLETLGGRGECQRPTFISSAVVANSSAVRVVSPRQAVAVKLPTTVHTCRARRLKIAAGELRQVPST